MISTNFVVAVVTVVLRGLFDRILTSPPVVKSSIISQSPYLILIPATYGIYKYLVRGKRIPIRCSLPINPRQPRILDGRVHRNSSQTSSVCNLREHRNWMSRRFRSHRSRSRCRDNLFQAAKESLQMLHREGSSTYSISSKSASPLKCRCAKDNSIEREVNKERSPSVYSIKSDAENLTDRTEPKNEEGSLDRCKGYGDCEWDDRRQKLTRKRKRIKKTRKTRSGKIYSSYL